MNPPAAESRLAARTRGDLDRLFGKDRYHLADDTTSLQRAVGEARVGREMFPLLALLIVAVLGAEQWLANRFYRGGGTEKVTQQLTR